jgi:pilus assembly protein CpaD
MRMTPRRSNTGSVRTASGALALAAAIAAALSACAPDRAVTGSLFPYDHDTRHPIVLADGRRTLDVFVGNGRLDPRQRDDVLTFATEYRRHGRDAVLAQVPVGGRADGAAAATLDDVRAALAANGIDGGTLMVSSYRVAAPGVAAPIRLSFVRMQAKVASECGLWPTDLGVSNLASDTRNEPHWNLGCATRSNLAAQVADPVDLVRGRSEGRVEGSRRARVLRELSSGKDPSTQWRQDGQTSAKQATQ